MNKEREINKLKARMAEIEAGKNWGVRIRLLLDSKHQLMRAGFTDKEIESMLKNN